MKISDTIQSHFDEEAQEFDTTIQKLIPYYDQMIAALVDAIPYTSTDTIRVIDLGCGTGTIAKQIAEKFPNAHIVCLDIAANMIEIARHKLAQFSNIEYVVGDFSNMEFSQSFDVIVSSLAIHHIISDFHKKEFYTQIFNSLTPKGIFINADVVLASTDFHQELNMNRWIAYMSKSVSNEEITNKWIPTHKAEDHPAILLHQLEWFKEIGFSSADIIWKYFNFSVYCGVK